MSLLDNVDTAMEPEELQNLLAAFPVTVFKTVPWTDLPTCKGCPSCIPSDGCDSTAVLKARKWLPERDAYSATTVMEVGACCLSWELRTFIRQGYDVTVEVLMIREGA